jgi:hypothetical protein
MNADPCFHGQRSSASRIIGNLSNASSDSQLQAYGFAEGDLIGRIADIAQAFAPGNTGTALITIIGCIIRHSTSPA